MDKTFYINLPIDAPDQSVPALIRHAVNGLVHEVIEGDFTLVQFSLIQPEDEDDVFTIYVGYIINISSEANDFPDIKTEYIVEVDESDRGLSALTITGSPVHNGKSEAAMLLELASKIETMSYKAILDLVYHPHITPDGINTPKITVYYII